MSRRMIAKECGVPPTTAKAHFEKLIIEASKRWAEHRRQVVQQRNEARRNRVREAARGLLEVGVFPSQRKLRATGLVSATDLTRPAVRRVVSAIAAEYGWGPLGGMRDQ
jgi:AcrR family transcriptional regulator